LAVVPMAGFVCSSQPSCCHHSYHKHVSQMAICVFYVGALMLGRGAFGRLCLQQSAIMLSPLLSRTRHRWRFTSFSWSSDAWPWCLWPALFAAVSHHAVTTPITNTSARWQFVCFMLALSCLAVVPLAGFVCSSQLSSCHHSCHEHVLDDKYT
jgi:hypothetical protein